MNDFWDSLVFWNIVTFKIVACLWAKRVKYTFHQILHFSTRSASGFKKSWKINEIFVTYSRESKPVELGHQKHKFMNTPQIFISISTTEINKTVSVWVIPCTLCPILGCVYVYIECCLSRSSIFLISCFADGICQQKSVLGRRQTCVLLILFVISESGGGEKVYANKR